MTFQAKEPKFLWILLFILTITYAYALESTIWTNVAYGVSFLFFAALTMSYRLEVLEDRFIHVVQVFGFSIKKRIIHPYEVDKLTIIHLGQKAIILLHLKRGIRLKLQRFSPQGLEEKVLQFAKGHHIKVENVNPSQGRKRSN
ncbi:hypothetical protein [Halalkalibacter okhensis]|uniref:Uncharacterized protein n=1 Tax=Halalkalibacter okhensis TaxID=333138 RepID=A0A0B0IER5_9BACI|nr:hypothetical protein [Halalkalibacter okhensis]KHF41078.1 hypothetical protein LQ50_04710 [Halalkalibacter okhensis]